jgi:TolA-binding protein
MQTPTRRRASVFALCCGAIAFAVIGVAGCSREARTEGDIRTAFEKADYDETMVLCEHAIRHEIRTSEVYYYYGLALLESGRDFESFRRLHEAVALDSSLATTVAEYLLGKGRASASRNDQRRAADRLKAAVAFDASIPLDEHAFVVASAFYDERDYERARVLFEQIATSADTRKAEEASFKLSECLVAMGDTASAIETLDMHILRFPKGTYTQRAEYRLVNILLDGAQAEFHRGNYETVVSQITLLLERTDNRTIVQRARFLLGEAYERMGEYTSAYEQYKAIIDEDRGASGRIVDRARSKIAAFRDSGLL